TEDELGHFVAEHRGLVAVLADDNAGLEHGVALLTGLQEELWNVDQDVPVTQVVGDPAPSLEVEYELTNTLVDGHVHRLERRAIDFPRGVETMSRLKCLK